MLDGQWGTGCRARVCRRLWSGLPAGLLLLALTGCFDESGEVSTTDSGSPPPEIVSTPEKRQGEEAAAKKTPAVPGLSKAEYISSADRICGQYQPGIRALEKRAQAAADDGDYDVTADLFEQAVAESEREISALRDLAIPEGSESALSRMYDGLEKSNRLFRGSFDKLRSGDVEAFNSIGDQARIASLSSRRIAAGLGFRVCGRD